MILSQKQAKKAKFTKNDNNTFSYFLVTLVFFRDIIAKIGERGKIHEKDNNNDIQ